MKVYRGPSSKSFPDNSYEQVWRVSSAQLEEAIKSGSHIWFNLTKEGVERRTIGILQFENDDIVPMISALLARLHANQECLAKSKLILEDIKLSEEKKLFEIKKILRNK
jgi:hypothetical protein